MSKQETESQIDIAKRYPREITRVKARFLEYAACDQETAAGCFYSKPVDNKGTLVAGPSIRLAEIVANTYQNIKFGSRILEISDKWVTVQGVAHDLENNISYTSEIKRSIWSEKGGYRYSQSLIETTIKAAGAFAVRDSIFKIVPLGIFNAEIKLIKAKATGADSGIKLSERITNAFKYFTKLKITEEQIYKRLEISGKDEMSEEHLGTLIGIRNAIQDKEITPEEAFSMNVVNKEAKDENVAKGVGNILNDKKG
jgi:hypothetical protein